MVEESLSAGAAAPGNGGAPASAAVAVSESRRLRLFELALVLGVGFLVSTVGALHTWWTDKALLPEDGLSYLYHLLEAVLSIALLVYVLHRQGRTLRSIGLTARVADIPLALVLACFSWLLEVAALAALVHVPFPAPPEIPRDSSWLAFLVVLPSAAHEELIVRAFLMTEVAALTGSMALAVFASLGLQVLYHLYYGVPLALVLGGGFFVSAVYYASTRRITPVILSHALLNVWVVSRGFQA